MDFGRKTATLIRDDRLNLSQQENGQAEQAADEDHVNISKKIEDEVQKSIENSEQFQ